MPDALFFFKFVLSSSRSFVFPCKFKNEQVPVKKKKKKLPWIFIRIAWGLKTNSGRTDTFFLLCWLSNPWAGSASPFLAFIHPYFMHAKPVHTSSIRILYMVCEIYAKYLIFFRTIINGVRFWILVSDACFWFLNFKKILVVLYKRNWCFMLCIVLPCWAYSFVLTVIFDRFLRILNADNRSFRIVWYLPCKSLMSSVSFTWLTGPAWGSRAMLSHGGKRYSCPVPGLWMTMFSLSSWSLTAALEIL